MEWKFCYLKIIAFSTAIDLNPTGLMSLASHAKNVQLEPKIEYVTSLTEPRAGFKPTTIENAIRFGLS